MIKQDAKKFLKSNDGKNYVRLMKTFHWKKGVNNV